MGNTFSTRSGNKSRPPGREPETPQLEPIHKGFNPTRQDVQIAAHVLMGFQLQAAPGHLPLELALSILAHANYRPRITSSRAARFDYVPRGGRPWYLMTRMLPPDFGRATSITLQVRSEDRGINQMRLSIPSDELYYSSDGEWITDGHHHRPCSTWLELRILRPLRRSPPSPPTNGYVLHGCVLRKVPEPGVQAPPSPKPVSSTGDWDPDVRDGDEWLAVKHNGRDTWEIYHHISQATAESSGDRVNEALTIDLEGTPSRCCESYRVDWPAGNNPDRQDPEAFVDGEAFLSALMPGDKIVLYAGAQDPSRGMAIKEAVLEILYDVSI